MKKVVINREELYELYINQNLGINEIAKIYNVYHKVIARNLKEYNIVKDEEQYKQYRSRIANERVKLCNDKYNGNGFASKELLEKTKNTMLQKYGNSDIGFKNKDIQQKAQKTIQTKYNVSAISKSEDIKRKINETNLQKYGVKRAIMLADYKDKALNNRKEKYNLTELRKKASNTYFLKTGYKYPSQNPQVKNIIQYKLNKNRFEINNKIKNTLNKRYNRNYSSQLNLSNETYNILKSKENFINYINNLNESKKDIYIIADNLNVHYQTIISYLRLYNIIDKVKGYGSNFEKQVKSYLDDLNIEYEQRVRKIIPPYELDFYIPKYNLAIECNGTYWHSYYKNNDKKYHYNKSKLCEEKGIRLIHIWEYEWNNERQRSILQNIIKNALNKNITKIYARKCKVVIKQSKEMKDFFNQNNVQGFRSGKFSICLEYNNEIVMAYQMGSAFFGKGKYEWEVIRGATKLGYTVIGGASKIWKYFIDTYKPKSCVYYIDYNYFNGNSLKNLPKMKFIKTQLSFKNYYKKENIVRNRNPKKHKEIKELEDQNLVIPIYNAGTKVYVYEKE